MFLGYSGLEATKGLVDIGGGVSGALGMAAHAGVAFSGGGSCLRLFRLEPDQKNGEEHDKESRRWLDGYDKAVELVGACPSTRVLVICDREGDIWDLLARSTVHEARSAGALMRVRRSTRRRVVTATGACRDLWDYMADEPCMATKQIDIEACGGPRRRKARKVYPVRRR